MTDPYVIAETADPAQPIRSGGIIRPLLWLVLVISAAANVVTSSLDVSVFIGIGFGLLTMACGAALAVDHYRRRRR
jgi:hypothetical protein